MKEMIVSKNGSEAMAGGLGKRPDDNATTSHLCNGNAFLQSAEPTSLRGFTYQVDRQNEQQEDRAAMTLPPSR